MKAQVYALFPIPLYVANYEGDIKEVIEYFDKIPNILKILCLKLIN